MFRIRPLLAALTMTLAACAPAPQRAGIPTEWRGSPNYDERRPNFVIVHYTSEDDAERALAVLSDPLRAVSAHYLVARDGTIYQLVDERDRAWHAGESRWGATTDLNSASIGIELDNNGTEPFGEAQVSALLGLLRDVVDRNRIPASNILGHSDVAPRRKIDPGPAFPWGTLAKQGFGLWCEPPYPPAPDSFDAIAGLGAIGYDVADADAAIRAFRLHFAPGDSSGELAAGERALIQCLSQRAMSR
ncbi:MAG: N-acetylmuramoyl-L-alanine amidase [Burkholderiales bacterium]|nr:N-acetylmuramoyl-L-alanine amidase [Burkholderiales bacterium]